MSVKVLGLDGQRANRVGKNSGEPAPVARVRIRGGRITCTACGRLSAEVVLLEPDRPICSDCVGSHLNGGAGAR